MPLGAQKTLLRQMCADLAGKTEPEIAHACARWRTGDHPRRFPVSGELLDLMKNPYADPPNKYREVFGGGCTCSRCTNKTTREEFFKAAHGDYVREETTQAELAGWTLRQIAPSKLDDDEMHKRFLMTQELVRDHGMDWEDARRKVMVERTRELYPHFKVEMDLAQEPAP